MKYSLNRLIKALFLGLFLVCFALPSQAKSFQIEEVEAEFTGQSLSVNARFSLSLNEVVIDAIHNGIPVTLSTYITLYRPRRFYFDKHLAEWQFDYTLRYHTLTATYLLESPFNSNVQSYSKLHNALQHISRFQFNSEIVEETLPQSERGYNLTLELGLNIEALPAPLRVVAFVSPSWRLKSNIYEWSAQN